MAIEIERKFVISEIPPLHLVSSMYVEQSYLCTGETEIRIRKTLLPGGAVYHCGWKKGLGMIRSEHEEQIPPYVYYSLVKGIPLRKIRHEMLGDARFDIDIYLDFQLMVAEIEFESKEQARRFLVPGWCGLEVTDHVEYKNQTLWSRLQRLKER